MDYRTLDTYANATKKQINVVVEIPEGTHNKYEIDEETGDKVFVSRRLHDGLFHNYKFPFCYGFIPSTLAPDGDQLDVILISRSNYSSLNVVKCEIYGMIPTVDYCEVDNKIIAIPVDEEIEILHTKWFKRKMKKMLKFIKEYKYPYHDKTIVSEMVSRDEAIKCIEGCRIKKQKSSKADFIPINSTNKKADPFGTVLDRVNF